MRTYHDQVMNSVVVRVPEVDPDGSDSEAEALRAPADDGGRLQGVDERRNFPGGRGIPGGGCAGATRGLDGLWRAVVCREGESCGDNKAYEYVLTWLKIFYEN